MMSGRTLGRGLTIPGDMAARLQEIPANATFRPAAGLTLADPPGHNGRSFETQAAPRRPAVRPDFFRPHSGGLRMRAGRYPSMGDGGIRKDHAAPVCGETSPTPFRVVSESLETQEAFMPNATSKGASAPELPASPAAVASPQLAALDRALAARLNPLIDAVDSRNTLDFSAELLEDLSTWLCAPEYSTEVPLQGLHSILNVVAAAVRYESAMTARGAEGGAA